MLCALRGHGSAQDSTDPIPAEWYVVDVHGLRPTTPSSLLTAALVAGGPAAYLIVLRRATDAEERH